MIDLILAVLLTLPRFSLDAGESVEERRERLTDVARAIAEVSKNRTEAAALIAVAWHESKFSALVQANRCSELPYGMRCDNGKARSLFQLHKAACPAIWDAPTSQHTRLGAECAIKLLRWYREQCGSKQGAFGMYAARTCLWVGAEKRYATMTNVLEKMRKTNVKKVLSDMPRMRRDG